MFLSDAVFVVVVVFVVFCFIVFCFVLLFFRGGGRVVSLIRFPSSIAVNACNKLPL